jgi:hypothetical protein
MRLSGYVVLKKEIVPGIPGYFWFAYFRGTSNRIRRKDGSKVQGYTKQSDLKFDLLNNPMERGVITA